MSIKIAHQLCEVYLPHKFKDLLYSVVEYIVFTLLFLH